MNDRLPLEGIFPMHCSANVDEDGHVAVFFGLSGTGKTTLSADPERSLIGDDEHGWGDSGVFNIEGGCYAKVIRLSPVAEPEIFRTTRTFGTILENVTIDELGRLDLDDDSKTENTRAAYKLEQIGHALHAKQAGHPNVGDLPHRRRVRDPAADRQAVARAGALLLPLGLHGEARRHGDRRHRAAADVLDLLRAAVPAAAAGRLCAACSATSSTRTRPTSGSSTPAGPAGRSARAQRMPIQATRAMLRAALSGKLDRAELRTDEVFGFEVPVRVPGVDPKLLDPRSTWRDPAALRPQGAGARRDVRRQLRQAVRRRRPGDPSWRAEAHLMPRPVIWKPRYATRRMRERAWAKADLERERAAREKPAGPSLLARLLRVLR